MKHVKPLSSYVYLTVAQVARRLKKSPKQVRTLLRGPELDGVREGRRFFVPADSLNRYLAA